MKGRPERGQATRKLVSRRVWLLNDLPGAIIGSELCAALLCQDLSLLWRLCGFPSIPKSPGNRFEIPVFLVSMYIPGISPLLQVAQVSVSLTTKVWWWWWWWWWCACVCTVWMCVLVQCVVGWEDGMREEYFVDLFIRTLGRKGEKANVGELAWASTLCPSSWLLLACQHLQAVLLSP